MSKKTGSEEMLMRVFRVAELLASYESADQERQVLRDRPFYQNKKSKVTLQENTKH